MAQATCIKVPTIAVSGDVSEADAVHLSGEIMNSLRTGKVFVVLDLSAATYVERKAIKILMNRAERLQEYNGGLKIVGRQHILNLFVYSIGTRDVALCQTMVEAMEQIKEETYQ